MFDNFLTQIHNEYLQLSIEKLYYIGLFIFLWIIQFYFYGIRFRWFFKKKTKKSEESIIPFSVVVYAKNELENLQKHLPLWLNQDYEQFEVIVINDCSSDDTYFYLLQMKQQHPQLSYTTISMDNHHNDRKLAFTLGVKAAQFEWVLFTDATSAPDSNQWIRSYADSLTPSVKMVVGCSNFHFDSNEFSYRWIMADKLFTTVFAVSAATLRNAYCADFLNFAIHKSLIAGQKQFGVFSNFPTEEIQFIASVSHRNSAGNSFTEGIVTTHQTFSWDWWYLQKKRRSALLALSGRGTTSLFVESLSRFLYFAVIGLGIYFVLLQKSYILPIVMITLIVVRKLMVYSLYYRATKRMGISNLTLFLSTIYDWFSPIFYFFLYFSREYPKKVQTLRK